MGFGTRRGGSWAGFGGSEFFELGAELLLSLEEL